MLLSAATLSREDYAAPVYHNILDDLASIEVMNRQVHRTLIQLLMGGALPSPGWLGFAANKTGWKNVYAAAPLIVLTDLGGVKDTPALRASIEKAMGNQHDWANLRDALLAPFAKTPIIQPLERFGDVLRDLQDEVETLVDELVRVRLPLPTDLRYWARRVEDLSYRAKPGQVCGSLPGVGVCRWMIDALPAYELGVQTTQMMGWIAQMRAAINQQIATAGLTGRTGRIDLELTPSQRAKNAAAARATKSLFDPSRGAPVKAAALTPGEQQIAQVIKTQGVPAAVKRFGLAAVRGVQIKLNSSLAPGSRLAPAAAARAGAASSLLWPAVAGAALLLFTL